MDGSERHRQHGAAHKLAQRLVGNPYNMATIPNPAALLAPALPLPLQSGQLLAFAGPSYPPQGGEASIATDAVQTIGAGVDRLVSGPLPPVATVPPIGGFAPFEIVRAAEGLIEAARNAAGEVLDFLGQLWGALNNRAKTDGKPASYSRGAYKGSRSSTSNNVFQVVATGTVYGIPNGYNGQPLINSGLIDSHITRTFELGPGSRLVVPQWPGITKDPVFGWSIYGSFQYMSLIRPRSIRASGSTVDFEEQVLAQWGADTEFTIKVTPVNPTGAIPYLPDVPAVPAVADPAALRPAITVAAKAAAVLPAAFPSKVKPAAPVPVIPLALPEVAPLVEEVPQIGGAGRQVTTVIGTLRKLTPAEVPRIPPLPARPIPGLQRETTPAGQTLPAPAPAPATTPTDLRRYGSQVITSVGVRPDLASIAEEVGRLERKMGIMLEGADRTPDWFDSLLGPLLNELKNQILDALVVDVPAITYGFESPCDKDAEGDPLVHQAEIEADDYQPAIVARLDAIAEAMGVLKGWKQPTCRTSSPRSNVTVTAFEFNPEA